MGSMTAETSGHSVLTGLDEIDWAALEHAYGPAEDVPGLLRALASGNAEAAKEALYELWGTVWHQGSVYPATVPAVPFLARIATAGGPTTPAAEVLHLLGSIAESSDPRSGAQPNAVQAAVAACYDDIAPQLEATEGATRAAAMFVLACSAPAERVRPLFVERWRTETDPAIRAEALHALLRVDAPAAADLADEILSAIDEWRDDLLLLSSAIVWVLAGRALDERVLDAASAPVPEDSGVSHWYENRDLFELLVEEIGERHGAHAAISFLVKAVDNALGGPTEIVEQRLDAARGLIVTYRSTATLLAEPITRVLELDDEAGLVGRAISLLTLVGPAAAAPLARERLFSLAESAAVPGSDAARIADDALRCLLEWSDPTAPGLLARDLADRPRSFTAAAGFSTRPGRTAPPFDAGLLAAIRHRITEVVDEAAGEESTDVFGGMRRNNEPIELARLLGAWGAAAAPAVPELIRLLATSPTPAARALVAIRPEGPALDDVSAALRAAAVELGQPPRLPESRRSNITERIAVGQAIRVLSEGDSAPLLEAILHALGAEHDHLSAAAEAAADLPEHADVLVPRMIEALASIPAATPSLPAHGARMKLGHTLWRLTGDPGPLISVLRDTLDLAGESLTSWTVAAAADKATELGPLARELRPGIEAALQDARACPAAARALLAIDPEGTWATDRREELAERLISVLTDSRAPNAVDRALDLLADLAPLPTACAEKLRDLAERDERILAAASDGDLVRADNDAQARIRALLRR